MRWRGREGNRFRASQGAGHLLETTQMDVGICRSRAVSMAGDGLNKTEWDMRGLALGISGLAMAAAMGAPQSANATAAFDIFGTLGVQVSGATQPMVTGGGSEALGQGNAFVEMDHTDAVFVVDTSASGTTSSSSSTTDSTPGFANAPQSGGGAVDVWDIANGDTRIAGFQVEFAGMAPPTPGEASSAFRARPAGPRSFCSSPRSGPIWS